MKRALLIYYNFIICTALVLMGFLGASSYAQLLSAIMFFPLMIYFAYLIIPRNTRAIAIPVKTKPQDKKRKTKTTKDGEIIELTKEGEEKDTKFDLDRRAFIKLIGSAGLSVFLLSIFTKKAQGAFFGSVPGPGTVAIKDTTGAKIDPAIKHPTDGFRVAELDDSTPSYYGFIDKDGNWFIIRDDDGTYKYKTGSSGFSAAWTGRGSIPEIEWLYYDQAF